MVVIERDFIQADTNRYHACHYSAICLETVNKDDVIHALPCKHVFHRQCLETWFLEYHNACPVCWRVFFA